jgi:ABC-type transport system involved in multi-copper enzyme maturation permease subunit
MTLSSTLTCRPVSSVTCQAQANSFDEHWHSGATIAFPLQLLPALIGAFVGAPVLAREMETGTFRYSWTQGFGRARWIVAKMALIGASLAVIAGAFGVLASWYFRPFVAEGQLIPLDPRIFDLEGIAFPGWVLAAFAIGAFAGMLIRKVVPAMATAMAVVGA